MSWNCAVDAAAAMGDAASCLALIAWLELTRAAAARGSHPSRLSLGGDVDVEDGWCDDSGEGSDVNAAWERGVSSNGSFDDLPSEASSGEHRVGQSLGPTSGPPSGRPLSQFVYGRAATACCQASLPSPDGIAKRASPRPLLEAAVALLEKSGKARRVGPRQLVGLVWEVREALWANRQAIGPRDMERLWSAVDDVAVEVGMEPGGGPRLRQ
jgi:hypothetical protein